MQEAHDEDLLERARGGDEEALGRLVGHYRGRLRRMVDHRLDQRLRGRCDASDVVQSASFEIVERFPEWSQRRDMSFYHWCRFLTLQKLTEMGRVHLGTAKRDARRERPAEVKPGVLDSGRVAADFTDDGTLPDGTAIKNEAKARLVEVLEGMSRLDREVLVMRHFEGMSSSDVAAQLGIDVETARKRYQRALVRLKAAV